MSNTVFLLFKLNYDKQQQLKPNDTKTTKQRFVHTNLKGKLDKTRLNTIRLRSLSNDRGVEQSGSSSGS